MGQLLIVNGSPRAPRSNSARYAEIFKRSWTGTVQECAAVRDTAQTLCAHAAACDDMLLVFPLYADGVPAVLLRALTQLERASLTRKPVVHVLVNCGFHEPEQNLVAVDMVRFFCKKAAFPYGMTLCIGAGEAILNTPFAFVARRAIRKLARGVARRRSEVHMATLPLTKGMFVRASTRYWVGYGARHHVTKEQMETLQIEGQR